MPLGLLRKANLASSAVLPDELIAEIFSWLSVKHVMQLRCVNKFFKTLISDPYFVQMHLEKSTPTPNLALVRLDCRKDSDSHFLSQSIPGLLQNQFNSLRNDPSYRLINFVRIVQVVGSCNGLLCLICSAYPSSLDAWLCFWNPAREQYLTNLDYFLGAWDLSFVLVMII